MDFGAYQFGDEKNILSLPGIKARFPSCLVHIPIDVSRLPVYGDGFGESMELLLESNFCGTYHNNIGAMQKFKFAFGTILMTNEEVELSK